MKKILQGTNWLVWLTAIVVAVVMFLQQFITNPEAVLPHATLAWVWTAIASGYAGTDRIAQFARTSTLEYGKADLGSPQKLRWVIFLSLFLIAEGILLTVFKGVVDLPLDALVTAFGGAGISFVVGNKAIKAAASTSGTHKMEESNTLYAQERGAT